MPWFVPVPWMHACFLHLKKDTAELRSLNEDWQLWLDLTDHLLWRERKRDVPSKMLDKTIKKILEQKKDR